MELSIALFLVTGLFLFFLLFKKATGLRMCVICTAFAGSWVLLALGYVTGLVDDLLLVVLMVGISLHGIYELWEKWSPEKLLLFRLPLLLTLLAAAHSLFQGKINPGAFKGLGILWGMFALLYFYRKNNGFRQVVDEIIACCEDW